MTFQEWWIEYRGFDDPYKGSEQEAWNTAIEECAQRAEAYAYMSANFLALADGIRSSKSVPQDPTD